MWASGAARLTLAALSVGLVLVVGESALRSQSARNDAVLRDGSLKYRFNPYQRDQTLGYALRPDWETVHATEDFHVRVRTNQLGLRGPPVAVEPVPGALRILFAGDSYAFGFGVEDDQSFPARIGALLQSELGRKVEILNAGVPGWSSDQYMLYLRDRGLDLNPDLLVVAIMQNDVTDLGWHRLTLGDDGLPNRIESRRHSIDHHGRLRWLEGDEALVELPLPQNEWLATNSQLYHWIRIRLLRAWLKYVRSDRWQQATAISVPDDPIAELSPEDIQRGLETNPRFRLRYHDHLIATIESDARARGIPVRFVLIGHSGSDYSHMRQDCLRRDSGCFDTTPLFSADQPAGLSFPNDGHWTPAGHQRAADAISSWLVDSLFLAESSTLGANSAASRAGHSDPTQ